jgi:hypothetical protein
MLCTVLYNLENARVLTRTQGPITSLEKFRIEGGLGASISLKRETRVSHARPPSQGAPRSAFAHDKILGAEYLNVETYVTEYCHVSGVP